MNWMAMRKKSGCFEVFTRRINPETYYAESITDGVKPEIRQIIKSRTIPPCTIPFITDSIVPPVLCTLQYLIDDATARCIKTGGFFRIISMDTFIVIFFDSR